MTQPRFDVPSDGRYVERVGGYVYRVVFHVEVQDRFGNFVPIPFLFDTGSDLTTLPISLAKQFDIPYDDAQEVTPTRTAGGRPHRASYLSRINLAYPALLNFQVPATCTFNPNFERRGLLALRDVVPYFRVEFLPPNDQYPDGFVSFRRRDDDAVLPRDLPAPPGTR